MSEYFVEVKKLIEETYLSNDNATVIILTHSMGSPMMLYFLNNQVKVKHVFFLYLSGCLPKEDSITPLLGIRKKNIYSLFVILETLM